MRDLTSAGWIHFKGGLFLLATLLAGAALLLQQPDLRTAFLVTTAVVCGARFYYYAFYVIEHYVDDQYRFAGLWSLVLFLWRRGSGRAVPRQ
ncbi:MAG: hypothetical protein IT204_25360 [Fimbriimonadaceae bacterium]|nr:hypothetical protein [Fimbriimonadaceae bacterium]